MRYDATAPALARPRPLRAVGRPRVDPAVLDALPHRLRPHASTTSRTSGSGARARPATPRCTTPPASRSPPARSARASPTPWASRSPSTGCGPASVPQLFDHHTFVDLRRRRPRGGRQPRGGLAGRPPRPRQARGHLRRQPHHDRRPHRARPHRRRRRSASRPTAGTSSTSARSPTTSTRSRPPSAGPWPSTTARRLIVLRSHIGYPSPKFTDTPARPRQPVRRRRDRAPPRRSWACPTSPSGSPTTSSRTTARPASGVASAREAWEALHAGWPATARPSSTPALAGTGLAGLAGRAAHVGGRARRSPPATPARSLPQRPPRRRARPHRRRRRPHRQHRHRSIDGADALLRHRPRRPPDPLRASASTAWARS